MKREQRLRKEADFALAREQGRNYSNRYLALYVRPNGLGLTRVGVAAGKRLGKAHVRNRVKRLLREAARLRYPRLKVGVDIFLLARAACVGGGLAEVGAAADELLTKSRLLTPTNLTPPDTNPPAGENK